MFGVGRIGSYISRGVYTVSAPFHPFGGAVDVIVVEQQDGSYKSTPWYVRFGKFQGVLKATERVVSINVNGVDADFNMYLDRQGEAFFLGEFDIVDGVSDSYTSSVEEAEVKPDVWRTQKAISCNYEVNRANVVSELEGSNEKILTLSNSRQGKLFGRPFGRRSMKENACQDRESHVQINSASSLERAEIAADLLEVRWSTNLCTGKNQNISVSDDVKVDSVVSYECNIASSLPGCIQPVSSNEKADTQLPCSKIPDSSMTLKRPKACIEADLISVKSNLFQAADNCCINNDRNAPSGFSKVSQMVDNIKTEDKPGTPHCSIDEGLTGDTVITKEIVDGLPVEGSTTKESCKCLTSMVNELSSEELSAGTNHLNSLPFVSDNEYEIYANSGRSSHPSSVQGFFGDPMQEKCKRVTPSYFSNEQQFVFSDFDDPKLEKVEHIRTSSSECEECFSQGSLESGEFANTIFSDDTLQVTSKLTQDNSLINHPSLKLNLKRVSSPVLISQSYKDVDEEAIAPVAESLPDMLFDVKDLPVNMSQLYARSLDSTLEVFRMVSKDVPLNSEISGGQQHEDHSQLTTDSTEIPEVIKKIISDPAVEVSLCRHLLHEGMGYEAAACVFNAEKLEISNFFSLVPDILENDKLVVRIGGLYFPWDAAMPIASAIGSPGKKQILEPKGMIAVGQVDHFTSEGVTQNSINSQGKSWNIWPFSFKRSTSIKSKNSSMEASAEGHKEMGGNVPTVAKKKLRTKVPTSEQLASLNLKEGKNVVMFTFSTAMLGEQQVEARIFLWNWNARIVISDVDGTITKSDVLGQFMPLMGMDWSQTGVTHLFSAIKENGYQLLFLSARSISQAYHTRQFLINLKQDGKALPEGPVLISPDGLFPSLYREVIRRAPHEFKIACLEDVRVLFSADHNPFYAGFGNRDTDELSYLKMGIPKGKIFTINPKGQVVVNRRVDSKTYSSLYTLVHDMFPSTTLHEQEDYNSWNFWRLPPLIGMHNLKDHYMP